MSKSAELCGEHSTTPIEGWRHERGLWLCPEPGESVTLQCPAGRPDAVAGPYCGAHGGSSRALAEAESNWHRLAPESVGGPAEVLAAGTLGLQSPHAYVVLRPERGRWLAWLGLGSMLQQVPRADYAGCGRTRCRSCALGKYCGRSRNAFPDRDAALRDATALWRANLTERIAEIHAARGGTLSWGIEVTPLTDPIVIDLAEGQSAWDAAQARDRIGSPGLGMISGLRGTGEAI